MMHELGTWPARLGVCYAADAPQTPPTILWESVVSVLLIYVVVVVTSMLLATFWRLK